MGTTINKTIGTASRDYSTFTSWAAANGGSSDSTDTIIGSAYDDSVFDEAPGIYIDRVVQIKAATGEQHDGTAGTGVRNVFSTGRYWLLRNYASKNLLVRGIEINANGTGHANAAIIGLGENNGAFTTFEQSLVHNGTRTSADMEGVIMNGAAIYMHNCIVYNISTVTSGDAKGIRFQSGSGTGYYRNCTVHKIVGASNSTGIQMQNSSSATVYCQNCISTDSNDGTGTDFADFYANITDDHNLTSDTSAAGAGSLTSKTSANQFVSNAAPFDLHLKATADAIDAGSDFVNTPAGVKDDIDNYDRDAGGVTWDMGADQQGLTGGGAAATSMATRGGLPSHFLSM